MLNINRDSKTVAGINIELYYGRVLEDEWYVNSYHVSIDGLARQVV